MTTLTVPRCGCCLLALSKPGHANIGPHRRQLLPEPLTITSTSMVEGGVL
ncbi:hypothetical protein HMPREF1861_01285 [Corynebacterium kroppenstedtii]|nr:hypothetical protein HMPREF1861_01285 [Corynebacterium kroppenstedtii]